MKRIATAAAISLSVLAVTGCGGSSDADSPTVSEAIAHKATTAAAVPPTPTTEQSLPTPTTDDEGHGPAETARTLAAAYERQDWDAFCDLFGRTAMAQLRTGATSSGTDGETCPEILRSVLGEGMTLEPLDVSGDAIIDGDRATVGEISLVREDGEWKLAEGL